ncbi:putative rho gtpase-activating protein 100f isoform x15 [Lasius niger]|uniref:Putative rho gtpase-activating protein 100f isoform x15 n=1 Tax=Lasius niger TaxID=67767 RepID=A0A0J7L662_LASNI|nr:putative rho gtpase-activating protein 100f isoform x15 [Lasius niger]
MTIKLRYTFRKTEGSIIAAAALEAVERRGEMVVRVIEPRQMGRQASEAAKKFIAMQDPKHPIYFVEIIKRPGQTLGLYIREGNGVDRNDGVFISRIALETAVYNSGCLKLFAIMHSHLQVGDEILAVNLVDVTHMSLDDVVIIMSIPRRLVLATRHGPHQPVSHVRQTEHKAPPVVVIKRELNEDENDHVTSNHVRDGSSRRRGDGREMLPSRSRLGLTGLGSSQDLGSSNGDLYYNSRPEGHWSYQPPPPPVITHQPKPSSTQHFQPYERGYPKTLESLAEKVHPFYTGPMITSSNGRRMSTGGGMQSVGGRLSGQTAQSTHYGYSQHTGSGRIMPRSGSDQHLPRVDYTSITTPARHTLLRSSLKSGTSALRYNTRYGQTDITSAAQRQGQFGTLTRRHRPSLDYASDTEATCSSSPKSAYYYYRHNMNNPPQSSVVSHLATLSRSQIGQSSSVLNPKPLTKRGSLQASVINHEICHTGLRSNSLPRSGRTLPQQPGLRSGLSTVASGLIDQEDSDGALSAPELPSIRRDREFLKYKIEKPPTVGTPSSTSSLLSSLGETTGGDFASGVSGLLSVHLLAGRGLRTTTTSSAATTPSTPSGQPNLASCGLRDLYCVLECDRVHKARTVVRTGDLMFDWDETFELDLVGNRQLDLLVYSWDPQYRHKLCYKGSVHLASLLKESPEHQLAVKVEPRGTIYLKLRYTDAQQTFRRRGLPVISLATRVAPLFGVDLDTVVSRETKTGGVPGGVSTALAMGVSNVPIIVWRCVEEVERRGLDIIGLYRLCGSATKKRILREAFERNARSVNLSPDNVPDINVITGVLKDYLRELPEPLFTKCLYQMMVDALAVCLPDDPQGNAKLMFSILDCLPKVNRSVQHFLELCRQSSAAAVSSICNRRSSWCSNSYRFNYREHWDAQGCLGSSHPHFIINPKLRQPQPSGPPFVLHRRSNLDSTAGIPASCATNRRTLTVGPFLYAQVIVSSPGSPSSEESEPSPEPINKGLLGNLGYEKSDETTTTTTTTTSSASGGISIGVGVGAGVEQITPTSSVDTEEGNPNHPEEGEKGVEGDVEASDDDRHQQIPKTH